MMKSKFIYSENSDQDKVLTIDMSKADSVEGQALLDMVGEMQSIRESRETGATSETTSDQKGKVQTITLTFKKDDFHVREKQGLFDYVAKKMGEDITFVNPESKVVGQGISPKEDLEAVKALNEKEFKHFIWKATGEDQILSKNELNALLENPNFQEFARKVGGTQLSVENRYGTTGDKVELLNAQGESIKLPWDQIPSGGTNDPNEARIPLGRDVESSVIPLSVPNAAKPSGSKITR